MVADELVALCERLDPFRTPGRLTLIARMGTDAVPERLPPLVAAVRAEGHPVVWLTDPMHRRLRREAVVPSGLSRQLRRRVAIYSVPTALSVNVKPASSSRSISNAGANSAGSYETVNIPLPWLAIVPRIPCTPATAVAARRAQLSPLTPATTKRSSSCISFPFTSEMAPKPARAPVGYQGS
jgi:hypothetical protein